MLINVKKTTCSAINRIYENTLTLAYAIGKIFEEIL